MENNHKTLFDKNNKEETGNSNNQTLIDEIKILSFRFDKLQRNIEALMATKKCETCDNIFKIKDFQKSIDINKWYCPHCGNQIAKISITNHCLEKTCSKCGYRVILKRISRRKFHIEAIAPE